MKKILLLLTAVATVGCANAQNLQQDNAVKSAKYSVHCYFGGEVVLTTDAVRTTFSNGTWKIKDAIDGSEYESNAQCIVRNNG